MLNFVALNCKYYKLGLSLWFFKLPWDVLTNDTVILHLRDVYNNVKLPIYIFEERKWNSLYDVYYKQLHQVNGSGSSKNANPISESFVCPLTEIKSGILF